MGMPTYNASNQLFNYLIVIVQHILQVSINISKLLVCENIFVECGLHLLWKHIASSVSSGSQVLSYNTRKCNLREDICRRWYTCANNSIEDSHQSVKWKQFGTKHVVRHLSTRATSAFC